MLYCRKSVRREIGRFIKKCADFLMPGRLSSARNVVVGDCQKVRKPSSVYLTRTSEHFGAAERISIDSPGSQGIFSPQNLSSAICGVIYSDHFCTMMYTYRFWGFK